MPQKDFSREIIDFDTFTKFPYECEWFGQIKCCQKHLKVGQLIARSGHTERLADRFKNV